MADTFYVDRGLTQVVVGRKRPVFLADRLMRVVFHDFLKGNYVISDPNDAALIKQDTRRAPLATPNSLYTEPPTEAPFTIHDHALQDSLADETTGQPLQPQFNREVNKVNKLMDAIDLVKEVELITALQANLTNATAPTDKFDDSTGADPIDYILAQFPAVEDAIGASPNTLALDVKVARAIINHPAVKERALPTMGPDRYNTGIATMENVLANLLGLDEVLIANGSIRNIARKKETKNIVRTWGDNMVLAYVEEPTLEGYAGLGLTVKWNPPTETGEEVREGRVVMKERLNGFRKGWAYAVQEYYTHIFTMAGAGVWIPDTLT